MRVEDDHGTETGDGCEHRGASADDDPAPGRGLCPCFGLKRHRVTGPFQAGGERHGVRPRGGEHQHVAVAVSSRLGGRLDGREPRCRRREPKDRGTRRKCLDRRRGYLALETRGAGVAAEALAACCSPLAGSARTSLGGDAATKQRPQAARVPPCRPPAQLDDRRWGPERHELAHRAEVDLRRPRRSISRPPTPGPAARGERTRTMQPTLSPPARAPLGPRRQRCGRSRSRREVLQRTMFIARQGLRQAAPAYPRTSARGPGRARVRRRDRRPARPR